MRVCTLTAFDGFHLNCPEIRLEWTGETPTLPLAIVEIFGVQDLDLFLPANI